MDVKSSPLCGEGYQLGFVGKGGRGGVPDEPDESFGCGVLFCFQFV